MSRSQEDIDWELQSDRDRTQERIADALERIADHLDMVEPLLRVLVKNNVPPDESR